MIEPQILKGFSVPTFIPPLPSIMFVGFSHPDLHHCVTRGTGHSHMSVRQHYGASLKKSPKVFLTRLTSVTR